MLILFARVSSPVGELTVATRDGALAALGFGEGAREVVRRRFPDAELRDEPDPADVVSRLDAYFAGDLAAIASLPVDLGGTAFQEAVWRALRDIPPGRTVSYAALARAVGRPQAVRAVGAANGQNPVAIVLPCHRVIGSDGRLTGYGGGLHRKRWLLRHEGVPVDGDRVATVSLQGRLFQS
jgi:methylated-DNA-[protein]-cysteine S-methyltransferase